MTGWRNEENFELQLETDITEHGNEKYSVEIYGSHWEGKNILLQNNACDRCEDCILNFTSEAWVQFTWAVLYDTPHVSED